MTIKCVNLTYKTNRALLACFSVLHAGPAAPRAASEAGLDSRFDVHGHVRRRLRILGASALHGAADSADFLRSQRSLVHRHVCAVAAAVG